MNFFGPRNPSRRVFMAQAAALGVAGTTASALWSGSAKASPVRGGSLKVGIGQGSSGEDLNPLTTGNVYLYVARWSVFNNLVELDSDKNLVPELAESWDVNADATDWLFTLPQGRDIPQRQVARCRRRRPLQSIFIAVTTRRRPPNLCCKT